jgi:hypothetical protein
MSGVVATNPGGNSPASEGPENALSAGGKWLDFNYGDLVLAFPNDVQVASYTFSTASYWQRTPVRWTLDASSDGVNWQQLDNTHETTSYAMTDNGTGRCAGCVHGPFSLV